MLNTFIIIRFVFFGGSPSDIDQWLGIDIAFNSTPDVSQPGVAHIRFMACPHDKFHAEEKWVVPSFPFGVRAHRFAFQPLVPWFSLYLTALQRCYWWQGE
jgi:hypothetical protein